MVFSSPIFLFLFLPIVLAGCLLPGLRLRNFWLLTFSILFYAWGEVGFVGLMLASTVINYFLGRWVEMETDQRRRRWAVGVALVFNLGLLGVFKYTNFAVHNLNAILGIVGVKPVVVQDVRLPIGISFFTFHAISYVMDIYRRKWVAAKNPADVALYIFFFPQLIAGPILRWNAIAPQIASRRQTSERFAYGIRRFAEGLAKKVIIANAVAVPADAIFGLSADWRDMTMATAWVGAICYMLQIYFDFSGYSDMAIGLGAMFGFEFMENFNHPYVAQSIRDFWRRWHISLSSWFRDYLYIPLGGNRCSEKRNKFNLVIVFLLCGLWHGASWTFVLWGLYHGAFIVMEHGQAGRNLDRIPRPLRHCYALVVVLVGWVLFRAPSLWVAVGYLCNMAGIRLGGVAPAPLVGRINHQAAFAIIAGLILATPVWPWVKSWAAVKLEKLPRAWGSAVQGVGSGAQLALILAMLIISAAWLAGGTYNPFIYFRF
ncbi:MAG TPA: MBOAT family protein [Verrucomicrobiae bacterium]|jgi:alginate O-acetyltransferase complex protein AlgI|nr:MBOAT family protein [Verrucomicrobiae bacterium]